MTVPIANGKTRCGGARYQRGVIVPFFILGVLGLVALAVSIFNTGDYLSERIQVRNAADAAAIAQGTWAARSLNVMSMNNVALTQTGSLVAITEVLLVSAGAVALEAAIRKVPEYTSCLPWCAPLLADLTARVLIPLGRILDNAARVRSRFSRISDSLQSMNERIATDFPDFSAELQNDLAIRNGQQRDDVRFFAPFSDVRSDATELPVRVAGNNLLSFCAAGSFGPFGPLGRETYLLSHGYSNPSFGVPPLAFGGPLGYGIESAWDELDGPISAARTPHGIVSANVLQNKQLFGGLVAVNWGIVCNGMRVYELQDIGERWDLLAFVRHRRPDARLMPSLFDEPARAIYGHAQASVDTLAPLFSQDLYTPAWWAKLSPTELLTDPDNRDDIARAVEDFDFLADAIRGVGGADLGLLDAH